MYRSIVYTNVLHCNPFVTKCFGNYVYYFIFSPQWQRKTTGTELKPSGRGIKNRDAVYRPFATTGDKPKYTRFQWIRTKLGYHNTLKYWSRVKRKANCGRMFGRFVRATVLFCSKHLITIRNI